LFTNNYRAAQEELPWLSVLIHAKLQVTF